jgi:hypothetical protein
MTAATATNRWRGLSHFARSASASAGMRGAAAKSGRPLGETDGAPGRESARSCVALALRGSGRSATLSGTGDGFYRAAV